MNELFPQEQRDELISELHAYIEDSSQKARAVIASAPLSGSSRSGIGRTWDDGFDTGFRRAVVEMKRLTQAADKAAEGKS